jgi:hypothetical protein
VGNLHDSGGRILALEIDQSIGPDYSGDFEPVAAVPQMAMALILRKTSPGSGFGTGNSRIANVLFAVSMQAFIVFGIISLDSLPGQKNHREGIDPNALGRLLSAV